MTQWGTEETVELISCYDVLFDNVLSGSVCEVFKAYLNKTHNLEPLLFLLEVKKCNTIEDKEEKYTFAKKIMHEFVEPNSPKEINVSNSIREQALGDLEKSDSATFSTSLFEELRSLVYMDLLVESFPTFLTSDIFVNHIEEMLKTNTEYLSQIGTLKTTTSSPGTPTTMASSPKSPTRRRTVFSKEKLFFNDQDFSLMYDDIKADHKSFLSVSTSQYSNRRFKRYISTYEIPLDREEVFNIMTSPDYADAMEECQKTTSKVISSFESGRYNIATTHDVYHCPFPMTPRDFSLVMCCRRQIDGSILVVRKSVTNIEEIPYNKKHVRAHLVQGYLLEYKSANSCVLTILSFIDLTGPSIFAKLVKKDRRELKIKQTIIDIGHQRKKSKTSSNVNGFLLDSLRYYEFCTR